MSITKRIFFNPTHIVLALAVLTGCQSLHAKPKIEPISPIATPTTSAATTNHPVTSSPIATDSAAQNASAVMPKQFSINGKIGITTPKQTGSAFYVWTQQGQNFAVELAGALNAGQTKINYNGQSATLTNEKGTMNAANPEDLLFRATGWQAPISQLAYWIQGQPAPSDSKNERDNYHRLIKAQNGDWSAEFNYATTTDKLPNRLTARHPDGYKVVMTINRLK